MKEGRGGEGGVGMGSFFGTAAQVDAGGRHRTAVADHAQGVTGAVGGAGGLHGDVCHLRGGIEPSHRSRAGHRPKESIGL